MKKRILSTLFSILFATALFLVSGFFPTSRFSFALKTVQAQPTVGGYACVLQADTFFYAAPDESKGLFLLPVSYYVKLLEEGNEYSRVEYLTDEGGGKKLTGYVKTECLTFVDYLPKTPYFTYQFELHYRIEEGALTDSSFLNEITVTCTYYGDYRIGSSTYCYVLREDSFGYVPKPTGMTVPENTEYADYLASLESASSPESSSKEESTSSPAQVAILIALCLLVPVLAALILKPPRRPPYETE